MNDIRKLTPDEADLLYAVIQTGADLVNQLQIDIEEDDTLVSNSAALLAQQYRDQLLKLNTSLDGPTGDHESLQ